MSFSNVKDNWLGKEGLNCLAIVFFVVLYIRIDLQMAELCHLQIYS